MMNADGIDRRDLVVFEPVDTASEYAYYPMPVWAPDGSYALVAVSSPEPFALEVPTADIWRLPLSGEALRLATLRGSLLTVSMDGSMWSADRTHIGYTMPVGEQPSTEHALIVSNADGSGDTTYATGDIRFLGWADEGARFLFRDTESGEVSIGEVGQPPYPLIPALETDRVVSISWSGKDTVVYSLARGDGFSIWLADPGGAPRVVDPAVSTLPELSVYP
jgi:hypothetical protein